MSNLVSAFTSGVWAIIPERFEVMNLFLERCAANGVEASFGEKRERSNVGRVGGVAVIPVHGIIGQRQDLFMQVFGGTSTELLGAQIDAAARDNSVKEIILHVDSPGGSVYGLEDMSDKIYNARQRKPITAVSDSLMASAAYFIGSAADSVVVAPGGEVGSIGTVLVHQETSKADRDAGITTTVIRSDPHKAKLNDLEPLDEDTLAYEQKRVNEYADVFRQHVSRNRGVALSTVEGATFGQGRLLSGVQAVRNGVADKIATFEQVVNEAARRHG